MTILTGIMPVAPTAFETIKSSITRASDESWTSWSTQRSTASASWRTTPSSSRCRDERTTVIETALAHVSGRVPVCVATSHYSAYVANQRNREAQERGAAMVMMMPPFYGAGLSVDESALLPTSGSPWRASASRCCSRTPR